MIAKQMRTAKRTDYSTPHPGPLLVQRGEGELFCGTITRASSFLATLGYYLLLRWSIGQASRLCVNLVSLFRKLAGLFFHSLLQRFFLGDVLSPSPPHMPPRISSPAADKTP